jgi:hypothetical protein
MFTTVACTVGRQPQDITCLNDACVEDDTAEPPDTAQDTALPLSVPVDCQDIALVAELTEHEVVWSLLRSDDYDDPTSTGLVLQLAGGLRTVSLDGIYGSDPYARSVGPLPRLNDANPAHRTFSDTMEATVTVAWGDALSCAVTVAGQMGHVNTSEWASVPLLTSLHVDPELGPGLLDDMEGADQPFVTVPYNTMAVTYTVPEALIVSMLTVSEERLEKLTGKNIGSTVEVMDYIHAGTVGGSGTDPRYGLMMFETYGLDNQFIGLVEGDNASLDEDGMPRLVNLNALAVDVPHHKIATARHLEGDSDLGIYYLGNGMVSDLSQSSGSVNVMMVNTDSAASNTVTEDRVLWASASVSRVCRYVNWLGVEGDVLYATCSSTEEGQRGNPSFVVALKIEDGNQVSHTTLFIEEGSEVDAIDSGADQTIILPADTLRFIHAVTVEDSTIAFYDLNLLGHEAQQDSRRIDSTTPPIAVSFFQLVDEGGAATSDVTAARRAVPLGELDLQVAGVSSQWAGPRQRGDVRYVDGLDNQIMALDGQNGAIYCGLADEDRFGLVLTPDRHQEASFNRAKWLNLETPADLYGAEGSHSILNDADQVKAAYQLSRTGGR